MNKFLRIFFSLTLSAALTSQSAFVYAAPAIADNKRFNLKTDMDYTSKDSKKLSTEKISSIEAFKNRNDKNWEVRLSPRTSSPRSLFGGKAIKVSGRNAETKAENFIKTYKDMLDVDTDQLKFDFETKSPVGSHAYFKQVYKNIPVENAYVKVHFNKNGEMMYYQSAFEPVIETDLIAAVSQDGAANIAAADLNVMGTVAKEVSLVLLPTAEDGVRLAWKVIIGEYIYYVDAKTSDILLRKEKNYRLTMQTDQYPVYPGYPQSPNTQTFAMPDVYGAYYASDAATNPTQVVFDATGKSPTSGAGSWAAGRRLFSNITGKYFNVTNAKMVDGERTAFYTMPDLTTKFDADERKAVDAKLGNPYGLAQLSSSVLMIADTANNRIRNITPLTTANPTDITINTSAGQTTAGASGDGSAALNALVNMPTAIAKHPSNTYLFFADSANNKVRAFQNGGTMYLVAGSGAQGFSGDGGDASNAALNNPQGIAVSSNNRLYIADTANNRIRYVYNWTAGSFTGAKIKTVAANLDGPIGLAVVSNGTTSDTVYFTEQVTGAIKSFTVTLSTDSAGTPYTVTGALGPGFADGTLSVARFNRPSGMSVDNTSDTILYVADTSNNRIRKVNITQNTVTTVAGSSGNPGFNGDGASPTTKFLNAPKDVKHTVSGSDTTLFIADTGNSRVRAVLKAGAADASIITIAGGGPGAFYSSEQESASASLDSTHPYPESSSIKRTVVDTNSFGRTFSCKVGTYRAAFVAPYFYNENSHSPANNFSVGILGDGGVILQKDTLDIYNSSSETIPNPLAKYIGMAANGFLGPIMYVSNSITAGLKIIAGKGNANTRLWGYRISSKKGFCIPTAVVGYADTDTLKWGSSTGLNSGSQTPEMNAYVNVNAMRKFMNSTNLNGTGSPSYNSTYIPLNQVLQSPTTYLPMSIMVNVSVANTPGGSGMVNAFYDPDIEAIYLGQGINNYGTNDYKNFAMENAIVRHEYMHYVMTKLWPIFNYGEGGAISEGMADYFALSSINSDMGLSPEYTLIGAYADLGGGQRDIGQGITPYNSSTWASQTIYQNSLVVSRLLWQLRTRLGSKANADKLIFYSLFFFPDTLLELRESMVSACTALGGTCATIVGAAFDEANIKRPASGLYPDIYEPNNGPVDAHGLLYGTKQISANLVPQDDWDFYAVTVPANQNVTFTLTMPAKANSSPVRYYPMGMILLDDHYSQVVDFTQVAPEYGLTPVKTLQISYQTPVKTASGYTGRYILGIYRPEGAEYSEDNYVLDIAYNGTPNYVTATQSITNVNQYAVTVPYVSIPSSGATLPVSSVLTRFTQQGQLDKVYRIRLLNDLKQPLTAENGGGDQILSTGSTITTTKYFRWTYGSASSLSQTISGTLLLYPADIKADFPYVNTIYVEVIGVTRNGSNTNETDPINTIQTSEFSYGISNAILLSGSTAESATKMWNNIFNPSRGDNAQLVINPPNDGNVTAKIYTRAGLLVKKLYDGPVSKGQPFTVLWDGKNESGSTVASGVYVLVIKGAGLDIKQKVAAVR